MRSGVYFFLKRHTIVYIGRTERFPLRFNQTNSQFDFDRIRFIECGIYESIYYERRWVKKFNPKYNKAYTSRSKKHSPGGGRKVSTQMDKMLIGEMIRINKNYCPRGSVVHFNKTRSNKKINFFKKEGQYFITRVQ